MFSSQQCCYCHCSQPSWNIAYEYCTLCQASDSPTHVHELWFQGLWSFSIGLLSHMACRRWKSLRLVRILLGYTETMQTKNYIFTIRLSEKLKTVVRLCLNMSAQDEGTPKVIQLCSWHLRHLWNPWAEQVFYPGTYGIPIHSQCILVWKREITLYRHAPHRHKSDSHQVRSVYPCLIKWDHSVQPCPHRHKSANWSKEFNRTEATDFTMHEAQTNQQPCSCFEKVQHMMCEDILPAVTVV